MPKPYIVKDSYFRNAKLKGYRARSAFKLEEIQEKARVLKNGDYVLDLGAFPGSFMQITAPIIGNKGKLIGIDLKLIESLNIDYVKTYVADIYDTPAITGIISENTELFDVILSDAAPNTSGISDVDHGRSVELNRQVFRIAHAFLKQGGNMVLKIFMGDEFDKFYKEVKQSFKKVRCIKPSATRDRSRETYIVALGYNG